MFGHRRQWAHLRFVVPCGSNSRRMRFFICFNMRVFRWFCSKNAGFSVSFVSYGFFFRSAPFRQVSVRNRHNSARAQSDPMRKFGSRKEYGPQAQSGSRVKSGPMGNPAAKSVRLPGKRETAESGAAVITAVPFLISNKYPLQKIRSNIKCIV